MCTALRELVKEEFEEGYKEGEARGFALALKLIEASRLDDLNRATEDMEFRRMLMKEFGID